jgi:parallel beta-helix repeat protein
MFTCLLKRGRPRPVIGLASVLLLVALLLTPPAVPARADTAVWTVTNTNGSGTGSFQDAMNQAIQHQGPNVINFNIPASDPGYDPDHGVWTIHLDAGYDLPAFGNTTIDGATQPQGPAQQTSPRIYFAVQVSGYPLFPISSSDNVLRGLGIMGFHQPAAAIRISGLGAWSNVIDNCVIGLAADGETARPFQNGVEILAPAGQNTVQNSTIADNTGHGVYIAGNGASSNTISANWISGNGGDGIHIQDGAVSNSIVDNTIESNTQNGIHVIGSNQTYIASNYIGYWAPEHVPPLDFANGGSGVLLEGGSKYTTVSGNRIAGNLFDGVSIGGANTDWNTVAANDIGYVETPQQPPRHRYL